MNVGIIAKVGKNIEKFTIDNAPTILTGVGVVGTLATAFLTGKGTVEAVKRVNEKKFIKHLHQDATETVKMGTEELSKFDVVKLTWTCYLPPVAAATITIGSIVMANRISAKRIAALAAGYGLLEGRMDEYKAKMQEKLGIKKETEARDEIAQDRVNASPPDATIIVSEGKTMFKDEPSGRYFESTMEKIDRAINELNDRIIKKEYAVLSDWYEMIGLPPTSLSEDYGWTISNELVDMSKHAVITQDGKPVICLDYNVHPMLNGYGRDGDTPSKIRAV